MKDFLYLCGLMRAKSLHIGPRLLTLEKPKVMAIINVTPDSFAVSCSHLSADEVCQHIDRAVSEGADIIDVGGYSTRSGAEHVSEQEEWQRVQVAMDILREHYPDVPVSLDTFRAEIARRAIEQYHIDIINDISGGQLDDEMFDLVGETNTPYVLMHMRGTPATMSRMTDYDDLLSEMMIYFAERLDRLHQRGVSDVIIDPGFGFAKTTEQNYQVLNNLDLLQQLDAPILVGMSRKSMIYRELNTQPTDPRTLMGTGALHMIALQRGANILRVHDVEAAKDMIKLYSKVQAETRDEQEINKR